MTSIVDTNVLLDVFLLSNDWAQRSGGLLQRAIEQGPVAINAVIYAELTPSFSTREDLEFELRGLGLTNLLITPDVAFLAGRAFQQYRRQGGPRTSLLADFFIGAQAAVGEHSILTRDPRRFRAYFPTVEIIEP